MHLKVEILCCVPLAHSKRKDRPKKKRDRGGKEPGMKQTKCCSICKQTGYTKPTCPYKEYIFTSNAMVEGITPAKELGLNLVFKLKF